MSRIKSQSGGYWISIIIMVICLVWITYFDGDKHYLALSLICLVVCMLPFYWSFEMRKAQAREVVFIAVLATMAALGRVAMAPFPDVKPTSFIVIVSALVLGKDSGFIIGSTAAIVSNIFLGQGPWTPWQMFCWGMMGVTAGMIKDFDWAHNKYWLAALGVLYGFLFGWIMDLWYALVYVQPLTVKSFIAAYVASFYFDLTHGITTAVLLFFFYEPWYRIINRFKYKYGLMDVQEEIDQQEM